MTVSIVGILNETIFDDELTGGFLSLCGNRGGILKYNHEDENNNRPEKTNYIT